MSGTQPIELRTPPDSPELIEAARKQAGQWVYEIDHVYAPTQRVPPEAIRGAWEVGGDGKLTGQYAPNSRYRPLLHQTPELKPYMHAGARTNTDQWIVDMDPRGETLFPEIPTHLIRGWWYVDKNGVITDLFRPNSEWVEDAP